MARRELSTVGELVALARERRPDDEVLAEFLQPYYRHLPYEDLDDRDLEDVYAAAAAHLRLGRVRRPDGLLVELLSPDAERDGWTTDRSILMFVTTDMPFLVDSVRMVLDRHGVGIHLLVHPILRVERNERCELTSVATSGGDEGDLEAWTQLEIDRCTPELRAVLEAEVRAAILEVRRVVADFDEMRDRLVSLSEGRPLLTWLRDPHFVYLGAASYTRTDDGVLELQPGTELGAYRPGGSLDPRAIDPPSVPGDEPVTITRLTTTSTIHRAARLTCLAIRPPGEGVEHRFVGLLGSAAYRESVFAIPRIAGRAEEVIELVGSSVRSHTGRAVRNTIETLPRDLVFEVDSRRLADLVLGIVGLQERRIVRVFHLAEPVGPFTTVFVFLPRIRVSSQVVEDVTDLVSEHYGGTACDVQTFVGTSSLARITMSVRSTLRPDVDRLAGLIDEVSRSWEERVEDALVEALGETEGRRVHDLVTPAAPSDYRARVLPESAVSDLAHIARLVEEDLAPGEMGIATAFGRSLDADEGVMRFRVYLRGRRATMAELVPVLDHLGLHALAERPSEFACPGGTVHLYDIDVRFDGDRIDDHQYREVQETFVGLVDGTIEADGLNRLVVAAGLTRRQVAVLRLYHRYLHQAGFPFSAAYVERSLVGHPAIARSLVELFDERFDPARHGGVADEARTVATDRVRSELLELLDAVPSLDDDRICRAFLTLVDATVRTSAFRDGTELAVKLVPDRIAFLPEPRPVFEIYVCSPWVEGVHLRGGPIARGGLRWSDRPEDFRTEVLGLVKAQMVKNAVIVPVGAKGGFVVKQSAAAPTDRDAVRAEGVDRYRRFVRALLDVTDNVVAGEVVHPDRCVVHDAPDPYLVVAADKGTASFSDIANELATDAGFWLGDAFASGGSNGYDHKAMGITARGAWESVRRHASVIGKDPDTDSLTAVGIGDMSGDVFGNGMLLSRHLRLVAAFDHRHVFLDPDPDPAVAFAERARLFALRRSSWADYDPALISAGGGVHSRSLKSIPITPEVRDLLDLDGDVTALRPDQLVSAILRAPVDLLWNGGIGTYVKASHETDESVGDRANDSVRIDATELRCRLVGEGGNLGFTQLGRIEYAVGGGLINTDAIDNSAGVDTSDHEVNIKVALDELVRDGDLTVKQRNVLLAEMTDEVAELVLSNNRAQTLALLIARRQAHPMVNAHARYLDSLEAEGLIDRKLEHLPSDKLLAERQTAGLGMVTPELAVLIAYTKNVDVAELLDSGLPDDPVLEHDLLAYFPTALRERCPEVLKRHRLRREIIATQVVNGMVNLSGISFDHRMTEGSGASLNDVTRAFVAARDIFGFEGLWREIDDLRGIDLDIRIDLYLDARRMVERGVTWLLRSRRSPLDLAATIAAFRPGIGELGEILDDLVDGRVADDIEHRCDRRVEAGVPDALAARAARWPWLHTGFDIVELAAARAISVADVARTYWEVFEALDLGWLWDGIGALPRSDRWQTQARASLRDDLMSTLADLAADVIDVADGSPSSWIAANERTVGRAIAMHTEIRRAESFGLTNLTVAIRQLRNLT